MWRNWYTRTLEVRVALPYEFESRHPHDFKKGRNITVASFFVGKAFFVGKDRWSAHWSDRTLWNLRGIMGTFVVAHRFLEVTSMNRREFISWVGLGAIATSLPVALAACSRPEASAPAPAVPAGPPRADGFQTVGSFADLKQKGSIAVKLPNMDAVVIADPAAATSAIAVNPLCTHKGCVVTWAPGEKAFVCPCHGAKFGSDGKVTHGPADKPLATLATKVEGDVVLIKAA